MVGSLPLPDFVVALVCDMVCLSSVTTLLTEGVAGTEVCVEIASLTC
jgi:hypothetical protein